MIVTHTAIAVTGVFVVMTIGTLLLWATLEPDCTRPQIASFQTRCDAREEP
jgi:hypothetical protein